MKKINTNFYNNNIPKEGSQCICLLVILIYSIFRTAKNYYPQVLLEKCKYVAKEIKMPEYITTGIKISSDDSNEESFDEENSDEEDFNEED